MLTTTLEEFMNVGVFAFMLTFVRIGTAIMIMPGIGDSFVSERIRLLTALAMTFALFPLTSHYIPTPVPSTFMMFSLIFMEFATGLFFGSVARIFMMATDTAGMVISTASGLGNAQVFNPSMATQGSLVGALMSVTGVVVLFALDIHHLIITGIIESYALFPVGDVPDLGSMAEFLSKVVSASFSIGVKMAAPFIVLTILIYVGMGVLARVMPQIQVFLLALPLQILLSMILLALTLFSMFFYWASQFEEGILYFFRAL
jgi:flagellar biosynthetic protein FliR